jgi:lipopolysaccharide export system protein LptA
MKLRLLLALFIFPLIAYSQENKGNQNTIHLGFQADFMRPAYPSYLGGRQVHKHEGNVIYTHKINGATITCDSAYHYFPSDTIEFFGNVVVRHESTTLYGEKIFYDGIYAKVRGRLVKMIDNERNATLKTQFVDYNIDNNIGTYAQGGTLVRKHDTIESINGIFEGYTGIFTFIKDVAMKNDSIVLACDTMLYDTHNDITTFKGNTKTWNGNNIMASDFGIYKPNENEITFSSDVHIQSEAQEVWADSVWFDNKTKNALLFGNIQMIDTVQQIIIFGDKARIDDNYQTVFVTENPAALYYSVQKEPDQLSDTTYLVADTICTLMENIKIVVDTIIQKGTTAQKKIIPDSLNIISISGTITHDSINQNIIQINDTLTVDSIQQNIVLIKDTLTTDSIKQNITSDTISRGNTDKNRIKLDIVNNKSTFNLTSDTQDSVKQILVTRDTTIRSTFAYHHVKIYKSDFQALCDSLVYHSLDSTTYMYHLPILWNENTQITSGVATFYSKNSQVDYAEFSSPALVIMREDSIHFSQMKGKSMKAFFKNNQIDSIITLGNGQSVYYIREKTGDPISAVEIAECANIVINMALINGKSKISRVKHLMKPVSNTYPIDKVPEDSQELKGFVLHDDIRPKSKDELFGRQVHLSQRSIYNMIEKPTFKITERINRIKEK